MQKSISKFFRAPFRVFEKNSDLSSEQSTTSVSDRSAPPKYTLLIIDDDESFLEAMGDLLIDAGYNVLTASSGPKALDIMRGNPGAVHLVLLDYHMPDFNGLQTLTFLRQLNPTVMVIGVSGVENNRLPPTFREGVNKLLQKPFPSIDLFDALAAVLPQGRKV